MQTVTENRDRINQFLQEYADDAAEALAKAQRKTSAKLGKGELLDYRDLENLTKAQAEANVWAKVAHIRDFWASNPGKAPERADLTEAAHEVRTEVLRSLLNPRGSSTSEMSNALDRAQERANREFVRLTAALYPEGSPLRTLGSW